MLKRTLFFATPCSLTIKNKQLVVRRDNKNDTTVPVDDLGFVILEHQQISVSMSLLEELATNNVAVVFCSNSHMPHSMLFPLEGNHLQCELFRYQISASEPLKKQLWRQTVEVKIKNQSNLLNALGKEQADMMKLSKTVKSGDTTGREGVAARLYWTRLFGKDFRRDRYGCFPNNFLNYGYIVLRAAVARALTGSGLLPIIGIHHHNRYNAYCLADDIIEPYRPFVDETVYKLIEKHPSESMLIKKIKIHLLNLIKLI